MTDLDELERLLREATVGPVVWRGEYAVQKMMHAINDEEWKLFCALRNAAKELIRDARRYREAEELGRYGHNDGTRDWVTAGSWLYPGDRIVVVRDAIAQERTP